MNDSHRYVYLIFEFIANSFANTTSNTMYEYTFSVVIMWISNVIPKDCSKSIAVCKVKTLMNTIDPWVLCYF